MRTQPAPELHAAFGRMVRERLPEPIRGKSSPSARRSTTQARIRGKSSLSDLVSDVLPRILGTALRELCVSCGVRHAQRSGAGAKKHSTPSLLFGRC
jgi:hypothetical protein